MMRCWNTRSTPVQAHLADSVTEKPLPRALPRAAFGTVFVCVSEASGASVRPWSGVFGIGKIGCGHEALGQPKQQRRLPILRLP